MALREMSEKGETYDVAGLSHQREFDFVWRSITPNDRIAIIEGGKINPNTGIRGDWSDGPFQAIYIACGLDEERAGMFYGNVWKKVIIEREERWVGIRSKPTFPVRGISLAGKSYFLDNGQ